MHGESFQVKILLSPQVGYGELADSLQVPGVASRDDMLVLGVDLVAALVSTGQVDDVFSAVAVRGPAGIVRSQSFAAGLY
jgi:hypothetical protein